MLKLQSIDFITSFLYLINLCYYSDRVLHLIWGTWFLKSKTLLHLYNPEHFNLKTQQNQSHKTPTSYSCNVYKLKVHVYKRIIYLFILYHNNWDWFWTMIYQFQSVSEILSRMPTWQTYIPPYIYIWISLPHI